MNGVWHVLGTDNPSGFWYLLWSGPVGDVGIFGAVAALVVHSVILYRKHICHVATCRKLGFHPVEGTSYFTCKKHHPAGPPTAGDIARAHSEARARARGKT